MSVVASYSRTDRTRYTSYLEVVTQTRIGTGTRGQPIYDAPTVLTPIWALLQDLTGRKIQLARQEVPSETHLVVTDYNPVITERCRLRETTSLGERWFDIAHIEDVDGRHEEMRISCVEEVPAAAG